MPVQEAVSATLSGPGVVRKKARPRKVDSSQISCLRADRVRSMVGQIGSVHFEPTTTPRGQLRACVSNGHHTATFLLGGSHEHLLGRTVPTVGPDGSGSFNVIFDRHTTSRGQLKGSIEVDDKTVTFLLDSRHDHLLGRIATVKVVEQITFTDRISYYYVVLHNSDPQKQ